MTPPNVLPSSKANAGNRSVREEQENNKYLCSRYINIYIYYHIDILDGGELSWSFICLWLHNHLHYQNGAKFRKKNYRDELNVKLYIPVQIRISGTMSPKVMIIFTGLRFVDPVGLVFVCWLFDTKGFTPQTG